MERGEFLITATALANYVGGVKVTETLLTPSLYGRWDDWLKIDGQWYGFCEFPWGTCTVRTEDGNIIIHRATKEEALEAVFFMLMDERRIAS